MSNIIYLTLIVHAKCTNCYNPFQKTIHGTTGDTYAKCRDCGKVNVIDKEDVLNHLQNK